MVQQGFFTNWKSARGQAIDVSSIFAELGSLLDFRASEGSQPLDQKTPRGPELRTFQLVRVPEHHAHREDDLSFSGFVTTQESHTWGAMVDSLAGDANGNGNPMSQPRHPMQVNIEDYDPRKPEFVQQVSAEEAVARQSMLLKQQIARLENVTSRATESCDEAAKCSHYEKVLEELHDALEQLEKYGLPAPITASSACDDDDLGNDEVPDEECFDPVKRVLDARVSLTPRGSVGCSRRPPPQKSALIRSHTGDSQAFVEMTGEDSDCEACDEYSNLSTQSTSIADSSTGSHQCSNASRKLIISV